MKKYLFMLVLLVSVLVGPPASAQQDPLYGLYLNNPFVLNPAQAGLHNNLAANISFRNQWAAFDGNPTTLAASGHLSLRDNKMGAGLIIINDRIGETSNTNISGAYAYKLNFDDKVFSFGMQAGLINYQTDPGKLNLANPDDAAFGRISETKFNLGAGAMLKSEKYLVGISVPRMMNNSLTTQGGAVQIYQQHVYLLGSYIHFVNERILLKPSVLLKGVKGAPFSADLNFNINIDRNYTAGIFTRNFKALGFLGQFNFMEKYRIAYLFELPANSSVGTRFSTHEIMLTMRTAVFSFHERSVTNF